MQLARSVLFGAALWSASAAAQDARGSRPGAAAPSPPPGFAACDAQATAKQLSGYARGLFISDCLGSPVAAKPGAAAAAPARAAATPAARTEQDRSNEQRKREMDQQQGRWDSTARRAMGSVCAGCGGSAQTEPARPARTKKRPPRRRLPDDELDE